MKVWWAVSGWFNSLSVVICVPFVNRLQITDLSSSNSMSMRNGALSPLGLLCLVFLRGLTSASIWGMLVRERFVQHHTHSIFIHIIFFIIIIIIFVMWVILIHTLHRLSWDDCTSPQRALEPLKWWVGFLTGTVFAFFSVFWKVSLIIVYPSYVWKWSEVVGVTCFCDVVRNGVIVICGELHGRRVKAYMRCVFACW